MTDEPTLATIWELLTEAERGAILYAMEGTVENLHMGTLPFVKIGQALEVLDAGYAFAQGILDKLNKGDPIYWERTYPPTPKPNLFGPNPFVQWAGNIMLSKHGTYTTIKPPPKPSQDAVWDGNSWKQP